MWTDSSAILSPVLMGVHFFHPVAEVCQRGKTRHQLVTKPNLFQGDLDTSKNRKSKGAKGF